jgi:hypothetical protein
MGSFVIAGGVIAAEIPRIIEYAIERRLPTGFPTPWPVERGGPMSFAPKFAVLVPALVCPQPVVPMRRIAILDPGDRALRAEQWQVLESRLRELGYVEG